MAKFVFSLQPVLRQREREEDRATRVLAERERERVEAERAMRAIRERMEQERAEWRSRLTPGREGTGTIDVRSVRLQASASISDSLELRRAALSLAAVERKVAEARRALLEVVKKRKAVELIRERRLEEWRLEESQKDQRTTDEIVTARAAGRAALDEGALT